MKEVINSAKKNNQWEFEDFRIFMIHILAEYRTKIKFK